jgi:hypothetical protein
MVLKRRKTDRLDGEQFGCADRSILVHPIARRLGQLLVGFMAGHNIPGGHLGPGDG